MTQTLARTSLGRLQGLLTAWFILGAAGVGGYVWVWGVHNLWAILGGGFFGYLAGTHLWISVRTLLRLRKNDRVAVTLSGAELTYILWAKPVALADIRDVALVTIGDSTWVRIRLNNGAKRMIGNNHIDQRASTVADSLRAALGDRQLVRPA